MQFFDQGRWFKEQALIPGLCQKSAARLCRGAGKRVKHEAQEKLQGCLDAQSSLFQDQWPLLCPQTLLLGASGDTGCREREWSWGWQSLSLGLWFSLGKPLLWWHSENAGHTSCIQGPSGCQSVLFCSQLSSPTCPRSLFVGGGWHGGPASHKGWLWLDGTSRQPNDVQGQSYCPKCLLF